MTRITKSFLRLCFVFAVVLGLSSGTAFAQSTYYIDATLTGGGGQGTQADPYRKGDFQAALDAVADGDQIVVLGSGTLTAPADGPSNYTLDNTITITADGSYTSGDPSTMTGVKQSLTLDLPFVFSDGAANGLTLTLEAADIVVPSGSFALGEGEMVNINDPNGWWTAAQATTNPVANAVPAAVRFTGNAQLRALDPNDPSANTIQRLIVEEGVVTTFFTQADNVNADPELTVSDSLDIAGELDMGQNDLEFAAAVEDNPTLSVTGSVTNGTSFRLSVTDANPGDPNTVNSFTTAGDGSIGALLDVVSSAATSVEVTFSEAKAVRVGNGGVVGDLTFSGLTSVDDSLNVYDGDVTISDGTSGDQPLDVGGDFVLYDLQAGNNGTSDASIDFVSNETFTVDGQSYFILAESATFNGASTFDQEFLLTDVYSNTSNDVVAFNNLATFGDDVTFGDFAGMGSNLAARAFQSKSGFDFGAPGIQGFGALSDFDTPASTIEGDFIASQGGFVTLSAGNVANGVHNLKFMEDLVFFATSGGSITSDTPPTFDIAGDARVIFGGTSQEIELGNQSAAITKFDVLSGGVVEVEDNNFTGTLVADTRIRILEGAFDTDGRLDPTDGSNNPSATLTRRISEDGSGTINGGGGSDFAYTTGKAPSNGGGGDDLPMTVEYIGDLDATTGAELPDLQDDANQVIGNLVTKNTATITVDVPYEVSTRLGALEGTLALDSDITMQDQTTVERGDAMIAEGSGALVYAKPSTFNVGDNGINLVYSNADSITTGVEFPTASEDADVIRNVTLTLNSYSVAAFGDVKKVPSSGVVALADGSTYRVNRNVTIDNGILDPNGQTFEVNTEEDDVTGGGPWNVAINYPGNLSGDGLFRLVGRGTINVIGTTDIDSTGNPGVAGVFPLPATEVDKPEDTDTETAGETQRAFFQIDDQNSGSGSDPDDGFSFAGDFTMTAANEYNETPGNDGVEFETEDVDDIVVDGNFVQNDGSFLAFGDDAGSEFTVTGSFTKDATANSRFYVGGSSGSVSNFTVGTESDSLYQANGGFYAVVTNTFTVNGDVQNDSGDSGFGAFSEAFGVSGSFDDAFLVTGDVTQNAGAFVVDGFFGSDGTVDVDGNFTQNGGSTSIAQAGTVTVDGDVLVADGPFQANLGLNMVENTFSAASLTVGDGATANSSAAKLEAPEPDYELFGEAQFISIGDDQGTYPDDVFANKAAAPNANDQMIISGATMVRSDGQLVLGGYELQQGGDFTLLGSGDDPVASGGEADTTDDGLKGLVRFNSDSGVQNVTTDGSPNTYFQGFAVDGDGVNLMSDVSISTKMDSTSNLDDIDFPHGILYLESGNIMTNEYAINILPAVPAVAQRNQNGDLIPGTGFVQRLNAVSGPVQGGARSSYVDGTMRRAISDQSGVTGGFVSGGYIFPLGQEGSYRAMILQPPTDLGRTNFATVTITEQPDTELDPFTVQSFDEVADELIDLELNTASEPYFNVSFDTNPNENFNARVIAGDLDGINRIKQMRMILLDEAADEWELAGQYDFTGDPNDDTPAGPNSFISGVPNIVHEGIDFFAADANDDGSVIGLATDRNVNPLTSGDAFEIAGAVTYGGGNGIEGATVTATQTDGDGEFTATTNADGDYIIAGVAAGNYDVTASVSGTPQGVTATDALLAVRGFAGLEDLSDVQTEVADVNDSGSVNATDALLIAQFAAGTVGGFDAGTFFSTTSNVDVATQNATADVSVAAYGDVDLGGGVGSSSAAPAFTIVDGSASKSAQDAINVEGGSTFELPIRVNEDVTLGAYTLTVNYPTDQVSFEGVKSSENVFAQNVNGAVRLAWFDQSGERPVSLSSGDVLVSLQFKAAPQVEKGSTFEVSEITGELAGSDASVLSNVTFQVPTPSFGPKLPDAFALKGNYPNPFAGRTQIALDLPEDAQVSVQLYDVLGRQVMDLPQKSMAAGTGQTLSVDGSRLGSGVYLYRVVVEMGSDRIQKTGRMTIVK